MTDARLPYARPDLLAQLIERLDAQEVELARLRALVEERPSADLPAPPAAPADGGQAAPPDEPVDRRGALRRIGLAAAGAAAGAAVLGEAGPAAAASITGDGNPGVTASGIGGHGLVAFTNSATSMAVMATKANNSAAAVISGSATDGTGLSLEIGAVAATAARAVAAHAMGVGAVGVQANAEGNDAIAVIAATAGTLSQGVQALSSGSNSLAVNATAGGDASQAVKAVALGDAGVAVNAFGSGTNATAVTASSVSGYGVVASTLDSTRNALRASKAIGGGPTAFVENTGVTGTALQVEAPGVGGTAIWAKGTVVVRGVGDAPGLVAEVDEAGDAVALNLLKTTGTNPVADITNASLDGGTALAVAATGDVTQVGVDVVVDRETYAQPRAGVGVRSKAVNPLHLVPNGSPPGQRTTAAAAGMFTVDTNNELWVCVNPGTPGFWRKIAGPSTAGSLHLLAAPVRVYDSRASDPPFTTTPKGKLQDGAVRTVLIDQGTLSGPVLGLLLNITVVNTSGGGFLSVYRSGIAWPGTSSMNWFQPNTVLANSVITSTTSAAQIAFDVKVAPGAETDFIADVVGYLL